MDVYHNDENWDKVSDQQQKQLNYVSEHKRKKKNVIPIGWKTEVNRTLIEYG